MSDGSIRGLAAVRGRHGPGPGKAEGAKSGQGGQGGRFPAARRGRTVGTRAPTYETAPRIK